MERKHRTILRHQWSNIRDNLEPNNILPKLVLVLTETDEEKIREQSTRQERCDKLLNILPTRGENAFNIFVNALVKEAPYLASELTEAEESCSRCEGFRNERDSARRKNQTLEKEIQGLKKKILASEQKLRKALDCLEKSLAEFKAKNVEIENMSEENKPLHEESNTERSKCDDLTAEIRRLIRLSPKMAGRIHYYSKDFDTNGVVYALETNFRGPNSTQTRIIATRSSDEGGKATDILENRVDREIVSGTKDEEQSWWCVDLTENYALYLTHYTLWHGPKTNISYLLNWRLEGSLDGQSWETLRRHDNDRGLTGNHPYRRCTWAIDGNVNAFRYFRILQTGKNSSGRFGIFLSGIELYGVLIEIGS
ncbi:PREDICTED: uncharacterized protein LOC107351460 [Acropora digitifera]|uniref:uncharacterized protein LOC107351460 n=1 Tax=Acropora digitifera TaxID=70779 RepID=UPI000779FB25|nr:PREDICTED: uncharacterized protein LOC107351460 [Acropora digitifera]